MGKKTSIALWILIWSGAAVLFGRPLFFPAPWDVARAFFDALTDSQFFVRSGFSLLRIVGGFAPAYALGVGLGVCACFHARFATFLAPLMHLLRAIPVASFVLLTLFFVPANGLSAVVIFVIVLPLAYQNTLSAGRARSRQLDEMAQVFRLPASRYLRHVLLPQMTETLDATLVNAYGLAWKAGIAAEVIAPTALSIGGALYDAKIVLDMSAVFAWTLWLVALSALSGRLLRLFVLNVVRRAQRPGPQKVAVREPVKRMARGQREAVDSPLETEGASFASDANERAILKPVARVSATASLDTVKSPYVTLDGVSVTYGNRTVLSDLSLVLGAERLALRGPSGEGKTTLLRVLAGLVPPTRGRRIASSALRLSMVFQEDRLVETLSVRDNLRLIGASDGAIDRGLSAVGMEDDGDLMVQACSGGMKRRVALLRALLFEGDVLLLDEPTEGLDAERRAGVIRVASDAAQRFGALVVVTHDDEEEAAWGVTRRVVI